MPNWARRGFDHDLDRTGLAALPECHGRVGDKRFRTIEPPELGPALVPFASDHRAIDDIGSD